MASRKLKGLVSTHHLYRWAGSEVVTFELLEELRSRGVDVSLYCPFVDIGLVRSVVGESVPIIFDPARVDLANYDFVLANHQTPSRYLALQTDETLFGATRPVFIYNHMSPHELFELPGPFCESQFADAILCNSLETERHLAEFGAKFAKSILFQNPAPQRFERCQNSVNPDGPKRLLSVSNHVPAEMAEAFETLKARGIEVTRVGLPDHNRQLLPEDLWGHDAVVTIGKTVQYALRARKPVFCYDIFQGPGWLNSCNYDPAADLNFSGRCHPVQREPGALVQEIEDGFADAAAFSREIKDDALAAYKLEEQVSLLLDEIETKRSARFKNMPAPGKAERDLMKQQMKHESSVYELVDREFGHSNASNASITSVLTQETPFPNLPIEAKVLRRLEPGKAMVVAAFSFRYDAHLVPGLLENLAPSIHAWVAWDDRQADTSFTGDANRQAALHNAALKLGADWILATDPDERFEKDLGIHIDSMTNDHGDVCWTFNCREMFNPTSYRVDGLWRVKPRTRLFPCLPGMQPDAKELHGSWTQNAAKVPIRSSGLDFYHLRMATPERRQHRRDLYAAADPDRRYQAVGYDYICDERGMDLEEIAPGREYAPLFREDNGIWAPPIESVGVPKSDAAHVRLRWAASNMSQNGFAGAFHGVEDAFRQTDRDTDLGLLAASLALEAGRPDDALRLCDEIKGDSETMSCAELIRSRAKTCLGDHEGARSAAVEALVYAPKSSSVRKHVTATLPIAERFAHPKAIWQRWAKGATLHEGSKIATSDIVVVVLGLCAPRELAEAVASLRMQDVTSEIVVVNSGGGNAKAVLRKDLDYIRLIDVPERVFPGCARNIGIDASSAPFVGFLASDCRAGQGWVRLRSERHRAGADVISSAVVPDEPANLYVCVSSAFQHWTRWPEAPADVRALYGNSYSRSLFEKHGYFPVGLRVAEDTYFNKNLPKDTVVDWVPDIQTEHKYPRTFLSLSIDMFKRGYRRADHSPFNSFSTSAELREFLYRWIRNKNRSTHEAILRSAKHPPKRLKSLVRVLRITSRAEVLGIVLGSHKTFRFKSMQNKADKIAAKNPRKATAMHKRASSLMRWHSGCQSAYADRLIDQEPTRSDEVVTVLRRATAADPRNSEPIQNLVTFLEREGRYAEAFDEIEHACDLSPRQPDFWWARNRLAETMGMHWEALYSLHRLLSFKPDDADVHEALASLHRRTGNTDQLSHRTRLSKALK